MRIPFLICFLLSVFLHAPDLSAQVRPRIIGGGDAAAGDYPWMAALVEKGRAPQNGHFCGGMLIAPQWVLTAAHCVEGENRNSFEVWVGLNDLRGTLGAQKRGVVSIFRHPNYRADGFENLFYDAALILLDGPISGIAPVELASDPSHNAIGEIVRVIGWGTTDPDFDIYPNVLQQADLQIYSIADAQADYQNSLGPYHLAAAAPDGSRDTCAGDSGGPIFRIIDDNEILVGITSFGDGCAIAGIEGIYTNVLFIRAWIDYWLQQTFGPPNLAVAYRGRSIPHGDRSPSRRQGTHFGTVRVRGSGKKQKFRAQNQGGGLLIAHGARISNQSFKFLKKPPMLTAAGAFPAMRIQFDPRRKGRITATVLIRTNDPDTPLYWFRVRGKSR